MDKLYHYTTFKSLDSIFRSKSIWLGNVHYMNDKNEMIQMFDLLKKDLLDENSGCETIIRELFEEQQKRLARRPAYIFSMSQDEDDAAQWDRYSNGGAGVCIQINRNVLEQLIQGKAELKEVHYSKEETLSKYTEIIQMYIKDIKNLSEEDKLGLDLSFDAINNAAITYKHGSFKSENEVRLCAFPSSASGISADKLHYIVTDRGIKEYYSIRLKNKKNESDLKGLIEKIILGPKASVDEHIFGRYLQKVAIEKNIDISGIEVKISESPLR